MYLSQIDGWMEVLTGDGEDAGLGHVAVAGGELAGLPGPGAAAAAALGHAHAHYHLLGGLLLAQDARLARALQLHVVRARPRHGRRRGGSIALSLSLPLAAGTGLILA